METWLELEQIYPTTITSSNKIIFLFLFWIISSFPTFFFCLWRPVPWLDIYVIDTHLSTHLPRLLGLSGSVIVMTRFSSVTFVWEDLNYCVYTNIRLHKWLVEVLRRLYLLVKCSPSVLSNLSRCWGNTVSSVLSQRSVNNVRIVVDPEA
jgi:hypothetical protein